MTESIKFSSYQLVDGKLYVFESDSFEPKEVFNKRCWYIINEIINETKTKILTQKDLDIIMTKSRCFSNGLHYGARY